MAAQSPSSSSPFKAVSSALSSKASPVARQPGAGKSELNNEVTTDQQWLEESQQAWAEQRAKELEMARAEKLGDRVLQLLEGETVGGAVGESLVVAQAKPAEDDRKAALPPKDEDDEGGFWWPALGLGLLGAAVGRSGSSSAAPVDPVDPPPPPPPPFVPGDELLVYSRESGHVDGVREEKGDEDTNTDEGPYQTVRVKAQSEDDAALLDDGVGVERSLYVEFDDSRDDLSLDVWAQGENSSATADINTDSDFEGDISVEASGRGSSAELYLDVIDGSGDAELIGTMAVEASARNADAYAEVSVYGDGDANAIFSVDLSVSTSERFAVASADIYVESESGDAELRGDIDVLAEGHNSGAEANVYVSAEGIDIAGEYTMTSGEDAASVTFGAAQWSAVAEDENTSASLYASIDADIWADINMDATAQASYGDAEAYVTLDIEASDLNLMGEMTGSATFSSTESSYSFAYGEDRAAGQFSSIADATDACSDMDLNIDAGYVSADVNFAVNATETGNSNAGTNTSATLDVDIDAQYEVRLGGGWGFTISSGETLSENDLGTTETFTGSVGEDMTAADWTSTAAGETAHAAFSLNVAGSDVLSSFDVDLSANIAVLATDGAYAEANIYLNDVDSIDYVTVQGNTSYSFTSTDVIYAGENGDEGEDSTFIASLDVGAVDWTSEAGSGACSDLFIDINADGYVSMNANLGATAGDDAIATTHMYLTAGEDIDIAGSISTSSVFTAACSDYVAYTESVSGEDSTYTVGAASWSAEANGHDGTADLWVGISTDGIYEDVDMAVNLTSVASSTEAESALTVSIDTYGFVEINGGTSSSEVWSSGDLSGDISVDEWTYSETSYAADWQTTASAVSAEAYMLVSVDANGIDLQVNHTVTASGTDSSAESTFTLAAESSDIWVGGDWTEHDSEEFGVTADTIYETENANWSVLASGTGSVAGINFDATNSSADIELDLNVAVTATAADSVAYAVFSADAVSSDDVELGWRTEDDEEYNQVSIITVAASGGGEASLVLDFDAGEDVQVSGDFTVTATGGSTAVLNMDFDAGKHVETFGDFTVTATGDDSVTTVTVDMDASEDVEFSGDITLNATGNGSHSDMFVSADAGDDLTFSSDITVNATSTDSEVHLSMDLDGGTGDTTDALYFDGDTTVTASGSNSHTHVDLSLYGEDMTYEGDFTMTASGSDSRGEMSVSIISNFDDISPESSVDFTGDTTFTASGSDSSISTEFFILGNSVDYDGDITLIATGSDSRLNSDFGLVASEDVSYSGDMTVQVGGVSGLDSDAVVHFSLDAGDEASFTGVVSVNAAGADNSATLFIDVSADYLGGSADMNGELNVTALDEGQATVSVQVEEFYSAVSLDADQSGDVNVTIVGHSIDSDIDVWTDNSGKVTLNMDFAENLDFNSSIDVDYSDFDSAITVHGASGQFDLVLENGGFDVAVDLETANYGGQFNLIVENSYNFSSGELTADFDDATYIEIAGFDVTVDGSSPGIDTIDFAGLAYAGEYIDATLYNGTGVSDEFSNDYDTLEDLLEEANDALVSDGTNDVDYFFGVVDGNGYLAVDGDGDGVDYIVELIGVTAFNWDSLTSTSGIYTNEPG
jgi:hypothetical protein